MSLHLQIPSELTNAILQFSLLDKNLVQQAEIISKIPKGNVSDFAKALNLDEIQIEYMINKGIENILANGDSIKTAISKTIPFTDAIYRRFKKQDAETIRHLLISYAQTYRYDWTIPTNVSNDGVLSMLSWVINDIVNNFNGGNISFVKTSEEFKFDTEVKREDPKFDINAIMKIADILDRRCGTVNGVVIKSFISCIISINFGDISEIIENRDMLILKPKFREIIKLTDATVNFTGVVKRKCEIVYDTDDVPTPSAQDKNLKKQNYIRTVFNLVMQHYENVYDFVFNLISDTIERSYLAHSLNSNSNTPIMSIYDMNVISYEMTEELENISTRISDFDEYVSMIVNIKGQNYCVRNETLYELIKLSRLHQEYLNICRVLSLNGLKWDYMIQIFREYSNSTAKINFKKDTKSNLIEMFKSVKESQNSIVLNINKTKKVELRTDILQIIRYMYNFMCEPSLDNLEQVIDIKNPALFRDNISEYANAINDILYCSGQIDLKVHLSFIVTNLDIMNDCAKLYYDANYESININLALAYDKCLSKIYEVIRVLKSLKVVNAYMDTDKQNIGEISKTILIQFLNEIPDSLEYCLEDSEYLDSKVSKDLIQDEMDRTLLTSPIYSYIVEILKVIGTPEVVKDKRHYARDGIIRDSNNRLVINKVGNRYKIETQLPGSSLYASYENDEWVFTIE